MKKKKKCSSSSSSSAAVVVCTCLLLLLLHNSNAAGFPYYGDEKIEESTSLVVTVTGCSNDCDVACCYCDIEQNPPLCVQCCQEDP